MYFQQMRPVVLVILLAFSMIISGQVFAANDAMIELLQVLRDNGTISEEAYSVLKNSAHADEERTNDKINKVSEEKVASVKKTTDKLKWAEKIKLKGDLRLRHQTEQEKGDDDPGRTRWRYRYRLGVEGQVNDKVKVGAGIASGGDDPRSTNETLDDQFETKDARLDYAFAEWKALDWLKVIGGKFKRKAYLWNTTDLLWDGDIRPEGASVNLAFKNSLGNSYVNAGYWVLDEFSSNPSDPYMFYGQAGHKWKSGDFFGNAAVTIYQFERLEGNAILAEHSSGGNTADMSGNYMYDYDSYGLSGEFGMNNVFLGDKMVAVFGDYIHNSDSDEDTGYALGFKFGDKKVKMLHDWQFKYIYADLEEDAWLDFLPDSDRFGGATGISAHEFAFKYGLGKNVYLGLDYYDSESELPGSDDSQSLLQTDLVFKF